MRSFVPTLINLGLVTLAAAQTSSSNSTSCVSSYQSCLDNGGADNTCQSENAKCKNVCADSYGSCLRSSDDSPACMNTYNSCLNSYTIFTTAANSAGKDCASLFSGCHDAGKPDNTCNSIAAQCKRHRLLLTFGRSYHWQWQARTNVAQFMPRPLLADLQIHQQPVYNTTIV